MATPEDPQRVWYYTFDSDGHLWHDGEKFDDPSLLQLFMKNMTKLPDGRFHVFCQGEDCIINAEDVPYVIQDVEFLPNEVRLKFFGNYSEKLDPATLFVGKLNVLYCLIRGGTFTARFNRKSYLDLTKHVEFDKDRKVFYLSVDNKPYPIKGVTE